MKFGVCALLEDPFFTEGRSRTIWAASTCSALKELGYSATLIGNKMLLPKQFLRSNTWIKEEVKNFYGLDEAVELDTYEYIDQKDIEVSENIYNTKNLEKIVNNYDIVHTRDPRLAVFCAEFGTKVIFEDHNESFHIESRSKIVKCLSGRSEFTLICITEYIKKIYEKMGVKPEKVNVVDSGVNYIIEKKYDNMDSFYNSGRKVIGYSGGLHRERDIETIINAAKLTPGVDYLMMGGRKNILKELQTECEHKGVDNIYFIGFLRHVEMVEIIKNRCHVLLYTRSAGIDSLISSPLKLFDYFNYGKPVVSVDNVSTNKYFSYKGVFSYNSEDSLSLSNSIVKAVKFVENKEEVSKELRLIANKRSWRNRQKTILKAAAVIL